VKKLLSKTFELWLCDGHYCTHLHTLCISLNLCINCDEDHLMFDERMPKIKYFQFDMLFYTRWTMSSL